MIPVRKIATAAIMSAVIVMLGITRLGFIPWFSGASVTILHIPVILAAILEGPIVGFITGAVFGLFSMLQATLAPTGPLDPAFAHPMVSLVPRLFIGPAAWLVFHIIKGRNKAPGNAGPDMLRYLLSVALGAAVGTLTNTTLVLSALFVFAIDYVQQFMPDWRAVGLMIGVNGLPEMIVAMVLSVAVIGAWSSSTLSKRQAKIADEEDQ
jgi:uncharacterized membrane protein